MWHSCRVMLASLGNALGRTYVPGFEGFLRRVRDVVERGRFDIGQLRLADLIRWLLRRLGGDGASLGELCGALEGAARLALLKARRLTGLWEPDRGEDVAPWLGPPPELPLRRSWLGERIASGQLAFAAPSRSFEGVAAPLAPIAPDELRRAMAAMLARERRPTPIALARPTRLSVDACSGAILMQLAFDGELRLSQVGSKTRDARIAAFLACLSLARQGRVALAQDALFGEIVVRSPVASLELPA